MSTTVEESVLARLVTDAPHGVAIPVALGYSGRDPLAVTMTFPPEVSLHDEGVTWVFARNLLDEGLRAPAGAGDVHVWPLGPARTMVELRSPDGLALLEFGTSALRRFLFLTYAAVSAEAENQDLDMDGALAELLGETR
ncbi:SsgA family sporulation/cell division regulator [Streptomyces sp. NPDC059070]|uniref:SsgA family sporulation/cell division regulator n=1 Tax=Streptomyces sp. NPDC059070 TaxID=3346713 RepID=UPI0036D0CE8A